MMDDTNEIYLVLQGWRPCAYHGGRFLHRGEWEPDRWYEFMTRDGTVFKARMKEDTHMDCFYPKAEKKENEVYFYREWRRTEPGYVNLTAEMIEEADKVNQRRIGGIFGSLWAELDKTV